MHLTEGISKITWACKGMMRLKEKVWETPQKQIQRGGIHYMNAPKIILQPSMMLDCFSFLLVIECLESDTLAMRQEERKHIMKKLHLQQHWQTQSERIKESTNVEVAYEILSR